METGIEKRTSLGAWALTPVEEEARNSQESAKFLHAKAVLSSNIFDEGYLTRLRSGDEDTAKHFTVYFRRMLRIKLWAKFAGTVQDDLMDDIMAAALEKILRGEPRDPACLAAYVRGICTNLAKRPDPTNHQGADVDFDQISDRALTAEEELLSEERARTVRTVLNDMKPRDRQILIDLFYHDTHRDEVCRKYAVTREQLRLILFRARGRFQKKWLPN